MGNNLRRFSFFSVSRALRNARKIPKGISSISPALPDAIGLRRVTRQNEINPEGIESRRRCQALIRVLNLFCVVFEHLVRKMPKVLLHNHPQDFEEKVLGWRFGPATRQG